MVDNTGGATGTEGGRNLSWLPWLIAALAVIAVPTAVDLAFYRDDAHDETDDHGEVIEDEGGTADAGTDDQD
jgi:hypothetical protein